MNHDLREWKKNYLAVKMMGQMIKDAHSTYDDKKVMYPPKTPLDEQTIADLRTGIENLLEKSRQILDNLGLKPSKPLWLYDAKDQRSWISSNEFIYKSLVKETRRK